MNPQSARDILIGLSESPKWPGIVDAGIDSFTGNLGTEQVRMRLEALVNTGNRSGVRVRLKAAEIRTQAARICQALKGDQDDSIAGDADSLEALLQTAYEPPPSRIVGRPGALKAPERVRRRMNADDLLASDTPLALRFHNNEPVIPHEKYPTIHALVPCITQEQLRLLAEKTLEVVDAMEAQGERGTIVPNAPGIDFQKLAQALRGKPKLVSKWYTDIARILDAMGKNGLRLLSWAIEYDDANADAHGCFAESYGEQGAHSMALPHAQRTHELERSTKSGLLYARTLHHDYQLPAALSVLEGLPQDNSDVCSREAGILTSQGKRAEAIEIYRSILKRDPENALAWYGLIPLILSPDEIGDIRALEKLATNANPAKRPLAQYALANVHHARHDYDAAFALYLQANAGHFDQRHCDHFARGERHMLDLYSQIPWDEVEPAQNTYEPTFILGCPNIGSTILERGITNLDGIPTIGESGGGTTVSIVLGGMVQQGLPIDANALANAYLRTMPTQLRGAPPQRWVDKALSNLYCIPALQKAFPKANFIRLEREMPAVLVSCLRRSFADSIGVAHTNNLHTMQKFWQAEGGITRASAQRGGAQLLEVHYEELIRDWEAGMRRILGHCRIPWSDRCLHPEDCPHPVLTANPVKAFQPVNPREVDSWRAYEPHLKREGILT